MIRFEGCDCVKVELQAEYEGADDGSRYVAMGFSEDGSGFWPWEKAMGNDAVIACYGTTVANYWNTNDPYYSLPLEVSRRGENYVNLIERRFCFLGFI